MTKRRASEPQRNVTDRQRVDRTESHELLGPHGNTHTRTPEWAWRTDVLATWWTWGGHGGYRVGTQGGQGGYRGVGTWVGAPGWVLYIAGLTLYLGMA